MQTSTEPCLDSLLVDDFQHVQDLVNVLGGLIGCLGAFIRVCDGPSGLELLGEGCAFEGFILLLLVDFSSDSFVACILPYVVLTMHKLEEVLRVHVGLELL